MRIMTKIIVNMGNNLRKSYSKYESHARMFATARSDLVVAGWGRKKKKKKEKKKEKKNQKKKNLGQKHKASVRRTGCLIREPTISDLEV